MREQEFNNSCKFIGADPIWMGFPDEYLENTLENRMVFVDMIRQVDPDLVITNVPNDYHPDHRYTHELVWETLMLADVNHVKTSHPATGRQVMLYFMDNIGGVDFLLAELVDITEVIEMTIGKFREYQAGCKYAEGFRKVEAW